MNKGLNSTTIQQVKEILLKTPSLQNKASLRALFRDVRLHQWYSIVPDASNTNEQIDALLDQLIDLENDQRENALVLFLLVISDQPTTPRRDKLQWLAQQVAHELGLPDPRYSPPPPSTEGIPPDDQKIPPRPPQKGQWQEVVEILRRRWQTIPLSLRWLAGVGLLIPLSLWLVAQISSANPPSPTPAPTEKVAQATTPIPTPTLGIGSTQISAKDGMVQVYVPAGSFLRGASPSDDLAYNDEFPQREVYLDAFWIDQYEVSNTQYAQFLNERGNHRNCEGADCVVIDSEDSDSHIYLEEGAYQVEAGFADHSMIEVSWYGAAAYCAWAGRRLPTEAEWEKAARGTAGQIYPWGDEFDGRLLNFCDAQCPFDWADKSVDDGYAFTSPVGSYPAGGSPYGALDMAGNVWEWVNDWYSGDYYETSPGQNPPGPDSGNNRVLRGGSWDYYVNGVRASDRLNYSPTLRIYTFGFRCVQEGFSP